MTEPAAAPAAPATAPAAAPAAPAAPAADWTESLSPEAKNVALAKGWKSPADPADQYVQLEKLMGAPKDRLLKLPESAPESDPAAWTEIYDRLGRPKDPQGYELKAPEGQDGTFAEWAAQTFHEAGITKSAAQKISAAWEQYLPTVAEAQEAQRAERDRTDEAALKREWGAAYDAKMDQAKAGAAALGISAEILDSMQKAAGYRKVIEAMQSVGVKVGEPDFQTGNSPRGTPTYSPAEAQARIGVLKADAAYQKRLADGDVATKAEWDNLYQQAYP